MPPKKSKGAGSRKVPGQPKRATSAYGFFVQDNQGSVKVELQGDNKKGLLGQKSKALSGMWREMDDKDKEPYTAKAAMDKERHKRDMEVYVANNPEAKKKSKVKDLTKPKKNLTGFFWFSNKNRSKVKQEYPEKKVGEISQVLGKQWKSMSDAEKQPYLDDAKNDKERYDHQLELWRKGEFNNDEEQAKVSTEEEEDDDDDYSDAED